MQSVEQEIMNRFLNELEKNKDFGQGSVQKISKIQSNTTNVKIEDLIEIFSESVEEIEK